MEEDTPDALPTAAADTGGTRDAIALYGGVFDPVHAAHLAVARAALDALPVARVLFLPAGDPPHKSERAPAPADARLAMLRAAITGEPRFAIDPRELERTGPSYTILTLEELAHAHPGARIFFLIGADNARSIGRWHRAEELFALCDPVIITRPGDGAGFSLADVPFLSPERIDALNRLVIDTVSLPHSSSTVRGRVARGESLDGWVPDEVAQIIAERGLYRSTPASSPRSESE